MKVEIPYAGSYKIKSARDEENVRIITGLISHDPRMFSQERSSGHITASAVILNRQRSKVLLSNCQDTGEWFQPFCHCDGIKDPLHVAKTEGYTISGLSFIQPITTMILDIDIHSAAERDGAPEHTHFDIRYAFWADENEPLKQGAGSTVLHWIPLDKLVKHTGSNRMQILRDKLAYPPFL